MDLAVALWFSDLPRWPLLDAVMAIVTHLGDHGLPWIAAALVLFFRPGTRRDGIACALALLLAVSIGSFVLKPLIARPRPFLALELPLLIAPPSGHSFPSNHASSSFAAATVVWLSCRGWIRWAAAALAAAIAFSRVYFTVHYVSDVMVGCLLGILCGLTVWTLLHGKHTKSV